MHLALIFALLLPATVRADSVEDCDHALSSIAVEGHGVRSDQGFVTFVLYGDNPDDFLAKGKKLLKRRFPAQAGTVEFCLPIVEPGIYAAAAYHDENGKTKFDKNWIGLPVEGFGVSNNPKYWLAPPTTRKLSSRSKASERGLVLNSSIKKSGLLCYSARWLGSIEGLE